MTLRDSHKTAAILTTAGALIAAAAILSRSPAGEPRAPAPTPIASPTPTPTPGPTPVPILVPPPTCAVPGGTTSAQATADLGIGQMTAGLSAGKILRGGGGQVFASFDLSAREQTLAGPRPPLDIALVIDRSGSMAGAKLAHAKSAALELISQLGGGDRVALVQYDDNAQVVVSSVVTDAEGKAKLRRAVSSMTTGGLTNLNGGMVLGRDEVQRTLVPGAVSRVILLSDGLANAGVVAADQISNTARLAADKGVHITTIGVGVDYNEDLMEAIAESGRGHYYYVRDAGSLEKVVAGEISAAQATVASQVELRLTPACDGVEIKDVLGYDVRRDGATTVVALSDLFGGDSRGMVVQLSVPDRQGGGEQAVRAQLRWRDTRSGQPHSADVALSLEVTDDFHAVDSSVDKNVMAEVLKAQAAQTVRAAAVAYDKGDYAGATRMVQAQTAHMHATMGHYNIAPAAAAPAEKALDEMATGAATVRGGEAAKDLVKKTKADAWKLTKGRH